MSSIVSVIIRILPNNEDVDISVPLEATATEIIGSLLEKGLAERTDQNNYPINYKLIPKGKNVEIGENETLLQRNISDGDILLMAPVLVAG